jgi:hypothetical protein
MIDWNLSDEQMRDIVLDALTSAKNEMVRQADRNDARAKEHGKGYRDRHESEACARYSRRQAAHYQQAIDALSQWPMPARAAEEAT